MKDLRILGTFVLTALIAADLIWLYFNGGVPSHHILQSSNLPAISNWWGMIVIPVLAWVTLSKIQKRINSQYSKKKSLLLIFLGLVFGLILSFSFINNLKPFLDNIHYVIIVLSLLVPIYMSEFALGFVFAMTFTFGAVLPTVFVLIISLVGFIIFRVRQLILQYVYKNRPNR